MRTQRGSTCERSHRGSLAGQFLATCASAATEKRAKNGVKTLDAGKGGATVTTDLRALYAALPPLVKLSAASWADGRVATLAPASRRRSERDGRADEREPLHVRATGRLEQEGTRIDLGDASLQADEPPDLDGG